MINRRDFVKILSVGALSLLYAPSYGFEDGSRFYFTQLKYKGEWEPRPKCHVRLIASVEMRTSIKVSYEKKVVSATDKALFHYPFLYLAGTDQFGGFDEGERMKLRKYLKSGGTLLIDDSTASADSHFDRAIRKELTQLLPNTSINNIPTDHAIYKSFYLLYSAAGRKIIDPTLEGITFEDENRTPVIYCRNDLGGAWEEDEFGKWKYACIPRGERQREMAIRLGINVIMYALTGNYKTDQVHSPFIRQRQRRL